MNKLIHFIKYHNAFTIGLALVFVFSGAIFASDDIRDNVIGEKTVTEHGIDNSQILSADMDNFNFQLTIQGVLEDNQNYYVNYSYQTLAISDNSWQPALLEKTLSVPKAVLATSSDLGFYAQGELGEVVDRELAYLKEVRELEKEKGQTQIVQTIAYTGLIGLVLDNKTKILPGYELPEKPVTPTYYVTSTPQDSGSSASELTPGDLTPGVDGETPGVGGPVNGANRPCSTEVGACRIGVQIYQDGVWGECIGAVFPTDEILDLVDNNCDGRVDEGLGTLGVGEETPSVNATSVDATATSTEPMATSTTP